TNIEHYLFDEINYNESEEIVSKINSLALNNHIFLLADSDVAKKSSKKGLRLKYLEENKKDNFLPYVIWNVREIENLLTLDVWQEVLISLCDKDLVKNNFELIQSKIETTLLGINLSLYSK